MSPTETMNIVIFGATGLIGGGVLQEALDNSEVASVLAVGRRPLDIEHPKLRQLAHQDFLDFTTAADALSGLDACFWCLGTSSMGVAEDAYTRITYDFTIAAAGVLLERNPDIAFCFVSGAGTNEGSRSMWARVKGRTESALTELSFRRIAHLRPGLIRDARHTRGLLRRLGRALSLPFYALARMAGSATSNVDIGKAMLAVASGRSDLPILNSADINRLASKS